MKLCFILLYCIKLLIESLHKEFLVPQRIISNTNQYSSRLKNKTINRNILTLVSYCQSVMKKMPTCNFLRVGKRMNRRREIYLREKKLILKREKEDFEIEPETRSCDLEEVPFKFLLF